MNHLFLDTSTTFCSINLSIKNELVYSKHWESKNNHSEDIYKYFSHISDDLDKVDYIGVLTGPGGFNSIRIGISFVLAVSLSKSIKLLALPTHQVQAIDFINSKKEITSIIQCGKKMISWAEFKGGEFEPINSGIIVENNFIGDGYCGETNDFSVKGPRPYKNILETSNYLINKFGFTQPENILPIYAREPSISKPNEPYKKFIE